MNRAATNEAHTTTWFVSRHAGAINWAKQKNLAIDRWVTHLDPAKIEVGDTVIGSLPVNLAAEVCKRGARYLHLSMALPEAWRGRELSAAELQTISAELIAFHLEQMQ